MNGLDQIPWKQLTHAYGSAADVPHLLRSLRTASPDLKNEDSPLWHLFGNIWHQGTVYEATPFAVPFLIELAADPRTPDRVGILSLLAAIASGNSSRDGQDAREELWARQAHDAVAAGFTQLVALAMEPGEVAFAAAYVLAQLPEHGAKVAELLRFLLRGEQRVAYRAGLLLLLGATNDVTAETLSALGEAVNSAEAIERHAGAYSLARLKVQPLPRGAGKAMMDAIASEDLEASLETLSWYLTAGLDAWELYARLDATQQSQVIDGLISALESKQATTHGVSTLVNLLFPIAADGLTPKVTAGQMTAHQARAVRALYEAMKDGTRVFYGHFPCWGLPDTLRQWRELASGCDPSSADDRLTGGSP